ncbi:hypothetical protein DFJ77DRAFT_471858 [Powellomyces hirtus]|nr:hypothetical protein DFJ77DRAFT_471858 [Powellomyces hirtus]
MPSPSQAEPNYAAFSGISSQSAAIVFAVLYVPVLFVLWLTTRGRLTYLNCLLTFFSAVRVAAFAMRAVLTVADNGTSIGLFITYSVLYSTGFVILLTATFLMLSASIVKNGHLLSKSSVAKFPRIERILRMVLIATIALGIWSSSYTGHNDADSRNRQIALTAATTWILEIMAAIALLLTLTVTRQLFRAGNRTARMPLLTLVAALILVRASFFVKCIPEKDNPAADLPSRQENLWYPFAAATELMAVVLITVITTMDGRKHDVDETRV